MVYVRAGMKLQVKIAHLGADCPLARNGGPLQLVDVSLLGSWRRCRYCFG